MTPRVKATGLSDVCRIINSAMGLHFPVERWDILARNLTLAAGGFGFENLDAFIQWLLSSTLTKREIELLASYLTNSETYFWRENEVFSALTKHILPDLISSKRDTGRMIRIWSAGCSTGEEAYSLAIALLEALPDIRDWKVTILATDINPKSLQKALNGIYTRWSFRNCPHWIIEKYFIPRGDRSFQIIPRVKNLVHFDILNLTENSYPSAQNNTDAMDLILCRNVLMYFSEEWVSRISEKLYRSLNSEGWFIVSSCELSSDLFPQFVPNPFPGTVLYRKSNRKTDQTAPKHEWDIRHTEPMPLETVVQKPAIAPAIIPVPDFNFVPDPDESEIITTEPPGVIEVKPEHVSVAQAPIHPDLVQRIRFMADQGGLSEALDLCNQTIADDKLVPALYFIKASILQELDKPVEAIASLRRSIYLDPNFTMGFFALGSIYQRQGNRKEAVRCFMNVMSMLKESEDDEQLPESDGLSVKYIREITGANLIKYTVT